MELGKVFCAEVWRCMVLFCPVLLGCVRHGFSRYGMAEWGPVRLGQVEFGSARLCKVRHFHGEVRLRWAEFCGVGLCLVL